MLDALRLFCYFTLVVVGSARCLGLLYIYTKIWKIRAAVEIEGIRWRTVSEEIS